MFESVREPGRSASLALAVAVHLAFFVFLYFGINWQRKPCRPCRRNCGASCRR